MNRRRQLKVSVIIPTLNEGEILEETLAQISRCSPHELIVCDGGSPDDTLHIAQKFTAKIMTVAPGRARQMNAGANAASGDILLFLHADTRVDPDSYRKMKAIMGSPEIVGGAFSLAIESDRVSLRMISALATLRAKYLNMVYGDQAIFVRKGVFRVMGGYQALPICEDLDFFKRLRKQGPVVLLEDKALTSARRWHAEGIGFTTFRNAVIVILFMLGFPPNILSKWYLAVR